MRTAVRKVPLRRSKGLQPRGCSIQSTRDVYTSAEKNVLNEREVSGGQNAVRYSTRRSYEGGDFSLRPT